MPGQSADRSGRVIESRPHTGLGTFGGVFTPSILTILGVIMYLRFGWVVGNVGLIGALIIVTLSTSITFLTGLSISEIATDQRVRVGGAYYMISRSLGIETGGAVGIPLYFAQALSVALYTVGFAESLTSLWPQFDQRVVAIIVTALVALVAIRSAAFAIRAQYVIMAAIAISLLSLLFGSPIEQTQIEMWGVPGSAASPRASGGCSRCSSRPSPASWPASTCPATCATPPARSRAARSPRSAPATSSTWRCPSSSPCAPTPPRSSPIGS